MNGIYTYEEFNKEDFGDASGKVLEILRTAPMTIQTIKRECKIGYNDLKSTLGNLIDDGKVIVKLDGNKKVYGLTKR